MMPKPHFLRLIAFLFAIFFTSGAFAAGYSCPTYKKYTSCVAGRYLTSTSVGNACNACGANSSNPAGNSNTYCTCNSGYMNASGVVQGQVTGGASCTAATRTCAAGTYWNGSTCVNCGGAAYYCPGFTNVTNPASGYGRNGVTAGYYTTGGTDANTRTGQAACGGNAYWCSGGVRNNVSSGYYTTGGTSTTRTGQAQCGAGTYCSGGVSTACAKGSRSAAGATACTACGAGTTTSGTGTSTATACTACPGITGLATWATPSWSANTVTNHCTLNTCAAAYYKSGSACAACSALTGVSVSGGTYTSAAGSTASTACKYTAPAKTITGCTTVTSNQVTYSGTAWPASTYSVTANAGYYIANNNTASATCTACGAGTYRAGNSSTATACSACSALTGVSVSGGTYTSAAGSTANTACKYTAPAKTITGCSAVTSNQVTYSGTAWPASTYTVTAGAGYAVANNNTASATCSICAAGTFSAAGSATCSACTGATYSGQGAASCSNCPTGYTANTASNKTAPTQCQKSCPAQATTNGIINPASALVNSPTDCSYPAANTVCNAGYYLSSGSCVQCGNNAYCNNNTRYTCPANNANLGALSGGTVLSQSQGWTNGQPTSSVISQCMGDTTIKVASGTYLAECAWNGTNYYGACNGSYLWYAAATGYYLYGYRFTSSQVWYTGVKACTNKPANAVYTGAGTPDTDNCPWTCPAGTYQSGNACLNCGAGYYCTGGTARTACAAGTASSATNATSAATCTPCTSGTYSLTGASACSACSALGTTGQSPTGGTYSSVSPFNAATTCRYTAPAKTITGCSAVTRNAVAWSGSSWSATTYTVTAAAGYAVANNNTASATCTQCLAGTASAAGAATCSPCTSGTYSLAGASACSACSALGTTGQSPTGGTYSSVSPFNAATTCRYTAPAKTITGCTAVTSNAVAWSGTAWPASTYGVTANAGYYIANNNTASATCTACGAGTYRAGNSSTATACSACSALTGVSVSGGTYTSAAGSTASTACKYTAPAKTITGCTAVTSNQVTYSGTAWPASTYSVTANAGYYIANNNTASATCTACGSGTYRAGGGSTATACTSCPANADTTNGYSIYMGTGTKIESAVGSTAATSCYISNAGGDWWEFEKENKGYWRSNGKCYYSATKRYNNCESTKRFTECFAGYFIDASKSHGTGFTNACSPCAAGTYTTAVNNISLIGIATTYHYATSCSKCAANTYSTTAMATSSSVCAACPTGKYSPAGSDEAADCGKILHTGAYSVYLRSAKKTTPSLSVNVGGTTYYGNMSTATKGNLRVNSGGTKYSVYDDSM